MDHWLSNRKVKGPGVTRRSQLILSTGHKSQEVVGLTGEINKLPLNECSAFGEQVGRVIISRADGEGV